MFVFTLVVCGRLDDCVGLGIGVWFGVGVSVDFLCGVQKVFSLRLVAWSL